MVRWPWQPGERRPVDRIWVDVAGKPLSLGSKKKLDPYKNNIRDAVRAL